MSCIATLLAEGHQHQSSRIQQAKHPVGTCQEEHQLTPHAEQLQAPAEPGVSQIGVSPAANLGLESGLRLQQATKTWLALTRLQHACT